MFKIVDTSSLKLASGARAGGSKYDEIIATAKTLKEGQGFTFESPEQDVKAFRNKLSYKLSHVNVLPATILNVRVTSDNQIAVMLVKGEHRKRGATLFAPAPAPAPANNVKVNAKRKA